MKKKIERIPWYENLYEHTDSLNLSNNICYDSKLIENLDLTIDFESVSRYPDPAETYRILASYHNVDVKNLAIGFGAGDVIFRLFQLFKNYTIGILTPTYELAYVFAVNLGINVILSNNIEDINTDILYLANPNGITGKVIDKEDILNLQKKFKFVIIDEAYGDFCKINFSVLYDSISYSNIIVVKTFSKTIATPGIRFGYCISNTKIIKDIQENRSSTVISNFIPRLIPRLISEIPSHITRMLETRKYIEEKYDCIPSNGNFVLFKNNPNFKCKIKKTADGNFRMALTDLETFKKLETDANLRYEQVFNISDFMSTLQSVEINPSEMCNRTCYFCPRSNTTSYKNRKLFIDIKTCEIIAKQLSDFNFKGRIGLVGFGEPLLNPDIMECIKTFRKICKTAQHLEIITNGDFLDRNIVKKLAEAGCTTIRISMYDKDDSEKFYKMSKDIDIKIVVLHYYLEKLKDEMILSDRNGIIEKKIPENNNRPCYLPFYKMFIDWNGDYILCNQDWGKVSRKYNIKDISISNFWIDKLNEYRKNLINGDRKLNDPCKYCNILGTLIGKENFNFISDKIK